jgi:hypothetical protein
MRATGYPITWPTNCFIGGGCGQRVFAHTNGDGDFVLFDSLGWPWPVHACYARRYEDDDRIPGLAPTVYLEYRQTSISPPENREKSRNIVRVTPDAVNGKVEILGRVQDIVENAAAKRLKRLGGLGGHQVTKRLGGRTSQLTILTDDFQSFTAFANLSNTVVSRGMSVALRLRAVMLTPGDMVFVVDDIKVFRPPCA